MANDLRDHVWRLDTAGAVTTETVLIEAIRMLPAAGTDRATLANGLGEVVWDSGATGATAAVESTIPFRCVQGMTLAYTSGTPVLYVYGRLDR